MQPTLTSDGVRVGGDARQRLHDARGYGRAVGNREVLLAPVEAAYLLYRGDLEPVESRGFTEFVRGIDDPGFLVRLLAYKDLRDRGYYLRLPHPGDDPTVDFAVLERGSDPTTGAIAFAVRVVDEGTTLSVTSLRPGVLAIVDEEGEVGYVEVAGPQMTGSSPTPTAHGHEADLVGNRVLVWNPPDELYRTCFFGQPLGGRDAVDDVLQLALVEAAFLDDHGHIDVRPGREAITDRARGLDLPGFDRRLAVYSALRSNGIVPKTGYKFGATFRVYYAFDSIDSMSHSDALVRVLPADANVSPQQIALDVRLAHGVGKRMVFALTSGTDDTTITWLSIDRLRP